MFGVKASFLPWNAAWRCWKRAGTRWTPTSLRVIGGAGNLIHGEKNKAAVDSYGREALEKTILDAIAPLQ